MDNLEKQMIIERYNKRLSEFGYNPKTLGWGEKMRHNLRYNILLTHWDLNGKSVLDFGCGFGDMYGYANKINLKIKYHGIDINENLIAEGKKIYPDANLYIKDIFDEKNEKSEKKYDYILSSGVHNSKIRDNWGFIKKTFEFFDKYSIKGFALNFLSDKVDYQLEYTYHANPMEILDLAYTYSNRITLRNDYMPFEFTIFIDKENEFDKEQVVYPDYKKYVIE
ncbi:MAG: methyltransferase domain-containing protein [Candidatus Melainabacteria bacterium]|nr:methyltransferase domain-containing protein [Candidatus Melainabacteria bacterium]